MKYGRKAAGGDTRLIKRKSIKIGKENVEAIPVTVGQLRYELGWLCTKVQRRDPPTYHQLLAVTAIGCHPSFEVVEGTIEAWERVAASL